MRLKHSNGNKSIFTHFSKTITRLISMEFMKHEAFVWRGFLYILFIIQKNSFQNRWNWYVCSSCEKNKIISGKLLWLKSPSVKTSISIFYWTLSCVQSFFALTQWGQKYYYVKFSYPYIFTNLYSNKDFHCFFFLQNLFFLIRFKAGFREKELKHKKYFTELLSCYSMLW